MRFFREFLFKRRYIRVSISGFACFNSGDGGVVILCDGLTKCIHRLGDKNRRFEYKLITEDRKIFAHVVNICDVFFVFFVFFVF